MNTRRFEQAFALPTVVITAVILMMLLVGGLSVSTSLRRSISAQYYDQLTREAAESGLAVAESCLRQNNYQAQWSDANPLRPGTTCNGGAACTGSDTCYVLSQSDLRTTFVVGAPTSSVNGLQTISVTATTSRVTSAGAVHALSTQSASSRFGALVSFQTVAFGYASAAGAFFGVIDATGSVKTVGFNGDGQLGNGTTTNTLTPTSFILPYGTRVASLYTSFLSVGKVMMAITTAGAVYGAGQNSNGQLGNGATATTQATPVLYALPNGVKASYAGTLATASFVIGSDYNIYAAGACTNSQLGTGAACATTSTPTRVALPTVNLSDANTLPVTSSDWTQSTNLAADRNNVFVRMQGGRVYGWGVNDRGQLANGTTTDSPTPVKIGTFGDSGQTQATQVAFDGDNLYVLDSNGDVYAAGYNIYGSLAGAPAPVASSTSLCLDNPNNSTSSGTQVRIWNCNNSTAQNLEWQSDGTIRFHPNSSTTLCLDNKSSGTANGNVIQTYTCNNSTAQQWRLRDDGSIYNPASGKCIDNPSNSTTSGTYIQLYTCNASAAQVWTPQPSLTLSKVPIPSAAGKVTRVTTDQWSVLFLTASGQVWGAGGNSRGQLGNGGSLISNPALTQYILPAGRTATDVYTTKFGNYTYDTGNTYVVLDDGSVYGSGMNNYGQLGVGSTSTFEVTPLKMALPAGVSARRVQSGLGTTVVLTTNGYIYTVGNNANGQLGDGTTTSRSTPFAAKYTNAVPRIAY